MKTWLTILVVMVVTGCATMLRSPPRSEVVLQPTTGNQVAGTVHLAQHEDHVQVQGTITGLTPGPHGFHIHEKGDCSSGDGMSAGGHFNPDGNPHGAPTMAHHAGDMGNIVADASGAAKVDVEFHAISLREGKNSIVGRALIVHADADDLKTQPTGNAGKRVACGVIGVKE